MINRLVWVAASGAGEAERAARLQLQLFEWFWHFVVARDSRSEPVHKTRQASTCLRLVGALGLDAERLGARSWLALLLHLDKVAGQVFEASAVSVQALALLVNSAELLLRARVDPQLLATARRGSDWRRKFLARFPRTLAACRAAPPQLLARGAATFARIGLGAHDAHCRQLFDQHRHAWMDVLQRHWQQLDAATKDDLRQLVTKTFEATDAEMTDFINRLHD